MLSTRWMSRGSREQTADERGFGDAADGQNHGAGAWGYVMLAHGLHHFMEGASHDLLQSPVDFVRVPHQAFLVLDPLEIAHGNSAGVGENVRQNNYATARQDFIGVRRGWTVGGFGDDACLNSFSVVKGDDVFERRRHQDVALHG